MKTRIEASMERSGRGEMEGPVYYGINSTARRSSQDCGGAGGVKKDINVINDDLADEIEAIRLAADFSSRRMLNDQKKEPTAGSAFKFPIVECCSNKGGIQYSLQPLLTFVVKDII